MAFAQAIRAGQLHIIDLDLTHHDQLVLLKEAVDQIFASRLDALINNAGLGILLPFEVQTLGTARQQFDINFFAPLEITRLMLPALRFGKGKIINISSIAGLVSFPYYSTYCASKYALEAWSESLAAEVAEWGIRVCLVEPGGFKTEFAEKTQHFMDPALSENLKPLYGKTVLGFKRMIREKSKFGQNPRKVANRIVDLCESKKPAFRNIMGLDAWAVNFAQMILPGRVFRWVLKSAFGYSIRQAARHNALESD